MDDHALAAIRNLVIPSGIFVNQTVAEMEAIVTTEPNCSPRNAAPWRSFGPCAWSLAQPVGAPSSAGSHLQSDRWYLEYHAAGTFGHSGASNHAAAAWAAGA